MNFETKELVFLLYDSRSGSTLLSSLLDQYSAISVSHESGFVPLILEYEKSLNTPSDLDRLLFRLYDEVQFRELNINREELLHSLMQLKAPYVKKELIETIIQLHFTHKDPGATFYVIKGPHMIYHIAELIELFGTAKFIHIVRDGRAVFNSKKTTKSLTGYYLEANLLKAAADWREISCRIAAFKESIHEFRYEDLIEDQEKTLTEILDYLGVAGNGRVQTKTPTNYAMNIGQKQRHLHANVGKELNKDLKDKWKESMTEADTYLYECLNAKYLLRYNYELVAKNQNGSSLVAIKAVIKFAYFIFHFIVTRARNTYYHTFIRRSLYQHLVSKYYEFKKWQNTNTQLNVSSSGTFIKNMAMRFYSMGGLGWLVLLLVTAMPGLQRIIMTLVVESFYGLKPLGFFTSDVSIASLLLFFTAIGWANLVIVRIPFKDELQRLQIMNHLLRYVIPLLVFSVVVIYLLWVSGIIYYPLGLSLLVIGWSGYQLIRHYFLAQRKYREILAIDVFCMTLVIALFLQPYLSQFPPIRIMAIPFLIVTLAGFGYMKWKLARAEQAHSLKESGTMRAGLEFGLTNFMGEAMVLLMGPTAAHALGAEYAGLIGLITSLLAVIILFPRALSFHYLPELVRLNKTSIHDLSALLRKFRRTLLATILLMSVLAVVVWEVAGHLFYREAFNIESANWIFTLYILSMIAAQAALPDANYLMINERSTFMVKVNVAAVSMFTIIFSLINYLVDDIDVPEFLMLLTAQLVIVVMRGELFRREARAVMGRFSKGVRA